MEVARVSNASLVALVVVSAAVFAALGHVLSSPGAAKYYSVDELVAHGLNDGDEVKVRGFVRAGSIERPGAELARFTLENQGQRLRVVAHGSVPVRDQAEVVVTGRVIDGALDGTAVIKCASGYREVSAERREQRFE